MDRNIISIMQQACIFAVIAQMIFYFRPNETYEKYLKLLIGILLMAVLFVPLLQLLHMANLQEFQKVIGDYEQNIEHVYDEIYGGKVDFGELKNQIEGNENQLLALEEEIKTRINNLKLEGYVVESVKAAGVTYEEDLWNLENIKLEIYMKKSQAQEELVKIDPIQTEGVQGEQGGKQTEIAEIKEQIENKMGIEKERVSIILNE